MSTAAAAPSLARANRGAGTKIAVAARSSKQAQDFWALQLKKPMADSKQWRRELRDLVIRVGESPGVVLFDAVEAGVPLYVVNMIAGATGEPISAIMDLAGVAPSTFHRREPTQALPDVAGHRVMGYLRVAASLRRLLEESGDPAQMQDFDLEAWVAQWMREALPELGGRTPAEMLRNPEGQRAVEQVLERMRGGLVA